MPAVSLASLVSALQLAAPGEPVRIDTQTGEIIGIDEALGPGSIGEAQRDRTITVSLDDVALAKRFCATVTDPQDRNRLETSLLSVRPIAAFEQALFRIQIAHRWFPFRDLELVRLAKAQLEAQSIPFVDDLA
jgi:hypothetical protein